jgi:hypothetical protein
MLSDETAQVIRNVQNRVQYALNSPSYRFTYVYPDTRKRFFAQFGEWFPASKKREIGEKSPQRIRHGIVMALVGYPIETMKDLPQQVWSILVDVTSANSRYLTSSISDELSDAVESNPFSPAYNILDWAYEDASLPGMQQTDITF